MNPNEIALEKLKKKKDMLYKRMLEKTKTLKAEGKLVTVESLGNVWKEYNEAEFNFTSAMNTYRCTSEGRKK